MLAYSVRFLRIALFCLLLGVLPASFACSPNTGECTKDSECTKSNKPTCSISKGKGTCVPNNPNDGGPIDEGNPIDKGGGTDNNPVDTGTCPASCTANSECATCPDGKNSCLGGICQAQCPSSCTTNADCTSCPSGQQTCNSGICGTCPDCGPGPNGSCDQNTPCAAQHQCLQTSSTENYCFKNCTSDADCPTGRKCTTVGSTTPIMICLTQVPKDGDCTETGPKQRICKPGQEPPLYCSQSTGKCAESVYVGLGADCSVEGDTTEPLKVCRPEQNPPLQCDPTTKKCIEFQVAPTLSACGGNTKKVCNEQTDTCVRFSQTAANGFCLAKCDPNNAASCTGQCIGLSGGGGACLPDGQLGQGKVCEAAGAGADKIDPAKGCIKDHMCITVQAGAEGVCMKRVSTCSPNPCNADQACLPMSDGQGGTNGGVCAKKCTADTDCTEADTTCQDVANNKICVPPAHRAPGDFGMLCNTPVKTKGCKEGLFCLQAQEGVNGYCSRDCTADNTCPKGKKTDGSDVPSSCVALGSGGSKLCVFDCSASGTDADCPVNLKCTTLQSGDKLCLGQ